MALPTFFLIGAMKAGTTSLHAYLNQHPEIHMSPVKEPHFFARPEELHAPSAISDRGRYEELFSTSAYVRGESSPTYSMYPRHPDVPRRISELVPNAKFLYLVRDPMDRVVSHYLHNVAVGGVRARFAEHIGDLSDRNNPYVYPSLYAMQLEQYLAYFPLRSFLVIDQAELATDRQACLCRIFEFLEVDPTFHCGIFHVEYGAAADRRQYPRGYEQVLSRLAKSPARRVPAKIRRSTRKAVEHVIWRGLPKPTIPTAARAQLASVCGPDVERLRAHTGLPLATWTI